MMGTSCYPLSPAGDEIGNDQTVEENDQLRVIIHNLGHCDDLDLSFIENPKSKKLSNI